METTGEIREISGLSPDPRVRVFRRTLRGLEEFESLEVDAYLVLGERYALFMDTLLCPADMDQVMKFCAPAIGSRQLLCVNSHADWDHIWGNGYFSGERGVPILAHELCRQRLNSEEARLDLAEYQERYPIFQDVKLIAPTLTFNERLTIDAGDLIVELLHAPGHCLDQIVAWLPETRLLLAFDTTEKPLPSIRDINCVPLMFATLERLAALNAQCALCSHGNTSSPALIQENLAYLREIERRARLLLTQRIPAEAELEQAAELIGYPFEEAAADMSGEIDRTYYSQTHEENARLILRWLLAQ